ncbi:MAG: LPS assembly protein LptD [Deltaproteobacteria bacterium]|nr:LPS assembly protein LptD [Deltaproteobacteria bacterium]
MRTKFDFAILVFLAVLFMCGDAPSWAQLAQRGTAKVGQEPSQEINLSADKLGFGDGGSQIEASGNVEIKRQQSTFKADEVRMNRETQDVDAKGRVSVVDPNWTVKSADAIQMNLEKETGEIQNGDIFIEQGHVSISGRRIQKFSGQSYHVDEAFFTTCLCESGAPSWRISADSLDLNLEGNGTFRNGYFYVLDVPVLYLPLGSLPLKTERQTGFLFPKFGQSTKDGFRFQLPFFWAISKSTDATATVDYESRSRVGFWGEARTKFDRDSDFELQGAYFNENLRNIRSVVDHTIADQHIPVNRWSVNGTHRYLMGAGWLTYSDVAAYGDDLFTRELIERYDLPGNRESDIRRSRYGESRFGVFKGWSDTFFKGEWNFYQDFIQSDKTTLQRTPQLAFWGRRFFSDFPLEFRWQAGGVNYMRRAGGDGLRFDLRPEVVLPFRAAPYLFGSLSVAPRTTFYHLYSPFSYLREPSDSILVRSSDRNIGRQTVEIRGSLGTSLSRIFAVDGLGFKGIKHVIEPEVSYLFAPANNQNGIPVMDNVDRINRRNVITLAVTNRLWGKYVNPMADLSKDKDVELVNAAIADVRSVTSLRLALSYDIDKERKGGDGLSDLDINWQLTPTNYLALGFIGGLNPGAWQVTQARTTLSISDPRPITRTVADPDFRRPNSLTFSYHFLRRTPNSFLADDANINLDIPSTPAYCGIHPLDPRCPVTGFDKNTVGSVGGSLFYHATDNLLLFLNSTYNVRDGRFGGIRATTKFLSFCGCWSATLGVRRNINPDKTSFTFDFNLLGVGTQKSSVN